MRLAVQLFATLKDCAHTHRLVVELPDETATVGALLARLAWDTLTLAPSLQTVIVAVNHEFAFADQPLQPGDDIAIFPPVSGG